MFCRNCGKEILHGERFCASCGAELYSSVTPVQTTSFRKSNVSPKSRTVTALLAFFLGGLGIHRFYVGKTGTGVLQILLTCCFGLGCIWALIDFIIILCGNFTDSNGLLITEWEAKY